MKSFTATIFVIAMLFLFSCGNFEIKTSIGGPVNVDSLMANFNAAWNTHDTAKVLSLITDDATLLTNETHLSGKSSIAQNFVYRNIPNVHSLETSKITQGISTDLAYESGTYSLGIVRNDTIVGTSRGNYTLIWKKIGDTWLLENIQMEGRSENLK